MVLTLPGCLPFLLLGLQKNGLLPRFFLGALCWRGPQGSLGSSSQARVLSPGWMRHYALRSLGREAAGLCSLCSSSYAAKPHWSERVSRRGPRRGSVAGLDAGASGDDIAWPFRRKNSRGQVEAMGSSERTWPARRHWRREEDEPFEPTSPAQSPHKRPIDLPRSVATPQGAWGASPTTLHARQRQRRQARARAFPLRAQCLLQGDTSASALRDVALGTRRERPAVPRTGATAAEASRVPSVPGEAGRDAPGRWQAAGRAAPGTPEPVWPPAGAPLLTAPAGGCAW
jgi:hypothetical protein